MQHDSSGGWWVDIELEGLIHRQNFIIRLRADQATAETFQSLQG
jgi:hypothetical protein